MTFSDRVTNPGRSITVSFSQSAERYWDPGARLSKKMPEGEHLSDRESAELQIAKCGEYAQAEGLLVSALFRRQWPGGAGMRRSR